MKFKKFFFIFLFLLFSKIYSLEIPERPAGRVSDYAKILRPEEVSELESILSNYEKESTNQIVIVIFNSLEGWNIEDFSIRLAEKWKIGQKGKDNGIIIVVALQERKIRIEVGYGLEGVVPDVTARQIIDEEIVPYFKKSEYYQGLKKGVNSLIKAIGGEYKGEKGYGKFSIPFILFWMIFLVLFFLIFSNSSYTYTRSKRKWYRSSGFLGGFAGSSHSGGFSGGGGSFGGGGATGSW